MFVPHGTGTARRAQPPNNTLAWPGHLCKVVIGYLGMPICTGGK